MSVFALKCFCQLFVVTKKNMLICSFRTPHSPASPTSHGRLDNGAVHPYDLPGQYQPQNEASVSESSPQQRSDVVREADTDWSDGMPLKDTAKKMLARFQSLEVEAGKQQQASVPRRVSLL